jgi:hypothetical protein
MNLIHNNPYRIAGILSNASERELQTSNQLAIQRDQEIKTIKIIVITGLSMFALTVLSTYLIVKVI